MLNRLECLYTFVESLFNAYFSLGAMNDLYRIESFPVIDWILKASGAKSPSLRNYSSLPILQLILDFSIQSVEAVGQEQFKCEQTSNQVFHPGQSA